jgi:hypothetical protein
VVALVAALVITTSVIQYFQAAAALLLRHMTALAVAGSTVAADLYQYITDNKNGRNN